MLIMFLFVGIIPGTNVSLSPEFTLITCPILAGLLISYAFVLPVFKQSDKPVTKRPSTKTNRLVQA